MIVKRILLLLLPLVFFLPSCHKATKKQQLSNAESKAVIAKIKQKGKIIASTDFNSINYFLYRGEPMGYQYELLQAFANYLGVKLEIVVNNDLQKSFECLDNGVCDMIAMDLTKTMSRSKIVDFSVPIIHARQMLVQRKYSHKSKTEPIRNPINLAHKIIYVQKGSAFAERLKNLQQEIGDTIQIVEDPVSSVEELVLLVAKGKIDYTICDEHLAGVYERNYPELDIKTPVSFQQNLGWAVKKGSNELLKALNNWITNYKGSKEYMLTYSRYFDNPRSVEFAQSEFNTLEKGIISRYDRLIQKYSTHIGWDWRLLASLIYQESGFQPKATSRGGAVGLMQLVPNTAKKYSVSGKSSPDFQINAGVKYLKLLDKEFMSSVHDQNERTKFVLASYNVGINHVQDAQRLAKKYKKDPNLWTNNVDWFMIQKSNPQFCKDSVVLYGTCHGKETYNFVNEVFERYYHYKNVTDK